MPGRRECLPSAQRDAFIVFRRTSITNEVAIRLSERYIDEFIRFCDREYGFSDANLIRRDHLVAYAESVRTQPIMKNTARVKLREVQKWLAWLTTEKVLAHDPAESLVVSELVP